MTVRSKDLFAELGKLIDLPRDCEELTIHLHVGQSPTVTTMRCVDRVGKVAEITRRYRIEEIVDGNEAPDATTVAAAGGTEKDDR